MKTIQIIWAALLALGLGVTNAMAQTYPDRPIKLIVPYPPAGTTDISARIIANKLGQLLGQSVIVENKPGAAGAIGTAMAAKEAPDGYTLVMMVESSHAVNPSVRKKSSYDPVKDFSPISNIMDVPNVLIVSPKVPAQDVSGLVRLLKASPGKYTYGSSGYGGLSNMNGELFKYVTQTDALHVPYNGMGPALMDIAGGVIDFGVDNVPSSLGLIRSGKVRALAIAYPKRIPSLPDLPTFEELGMPAMNQPSWYGIGAPAGVPDFVLDKLNKAVKDALDDPKVVKAIEHVGGIPAYTTRAEFQQLVASSNAHWKKTIKDANIKRIE
jgi:tripartite-type tricarboxylate transporter receptor subunit TctC